MRLRPLTNPLLLISDSYCVSMGCQCKHARGQGCELSVGEGARDVTLHINSLTVHPGETVGIIGKNGAGKSTLLDLLLNERERDSGTVSLFGLDNKSHEIEVKQRIGFVIDEAGFNEKFSLKEAGRVLSHIYPSWDHWYYCRLLDGFGLDPCMSFSELSKGMSIKGRLALAMAHRPELLILDEVTSGLDPVSRIEILHILKAYVEEDARRGLVYSTHITDDLKQLSSKIVFIDKGSIVYVKPVELFDGLSIDQQMAEYIEGESGV